MKKALITGVCGQDGAYLARLLIRKGYEVWGGTRRSSLDYMYRLRELGVVDSIELVNLDLSDPFNVSDVVKSGQYDEIYNLAAQSFVGASWDFPIQTSQVDAMGPLYLFDAVRRFSPASKIYQASTSEMFGLIQEPKQSETTPFYPRSPYGVAKQFAHSMLVNYRESFGVFGCSGILFNHESPLRGQEFVTKKITMAIARYKATGDGLLSLGNLDAKRDWGYAEEYVEGMWQILNHSEPSDFVLATGTTTTVRDFVHFAASSLDIHLEWSGHDLEECAFDSKTGKKIVEVNPKFYRPAEVDVLLGNPKKAEIELGWKAKTSTESLAQMMTEFDFAKFRELH